MATSPRGKKLPSKSSVGNSDFYIPPLPLVVANPSQSVAKDIMGWVAACVLIALLLPLMALMYVDILEAKNSVQQEIVKVEKLRREIEKERRDANPDRPQ